MKKLLIMALMVSLTALLAADLSAATASDVEKAIATANHEYELLTSGPDPTGLADQFTADASLLIPDQELISSREAIRQTLAQTAGQLGETKLTTTHVQAGGDLAFEIGTWTSSIGGEPTDGNYLTLWKFDGRNWLRAAMCSVPETWPPDLDVSDASAIFATAPQETTMRLVGEPDVVDEVAANLESRLNEYANLFNSGNKAALDTYAKSLYTSDAVVMLPETTLLVGEQQIVATCVLSEALQALRNLWFGLTTVGSNSSGDVSFSVASYYNDVQSERGELVPSTGTYLAAWVIEDGQWSIAASCTANSVPTPSVEYLVAK